MSRRNRNRGQIAKFVIHIREARYPGTAGSFVSTMQFTGKPESSAPHTPAGERHIMHEDNGWASKKLEPIIEGYLRQRYSDSYLIVEAAPEFYVRWKAGVTQEDREMLWRFERAIREIETEFERRNPETILEVHVDPKSEPVSSRREAAAKDKSWDAAHSYRLIVAELEQLECEGYSKMAADVEMSERLKTRGEKHSIPRIRKAREFVRREREDGAA